MAIEFTSVVVLFLIKISSVGAHQKWAPATLPLLKVFYDYEKIIYSNLNYCKLTIMDIKSLEFNSSIKIILAGGDVDDDEDEMDTSAMPNLGIRQVF